VRRPRTARQVLGVKTYFAAVNTALEEVVRMRKIQSLTSFFGTGLWQGDLAEMREDQPRKSVPNRVRRRKARG
jgi:hypothetical protein